MSACITRFIKLLRQSGRNKHFTFDENMESKSTHVSSRCFIQTDLVGKVYVNTELDLFAPF